MRSGMALAGALMLCGCATVTRGLNDQMQINSNPAEASVRTSMGFQCITPCTLQVGRKDEFDVVFSKAGYITETVPIRTRIAAAGAAGALGNAVVGGVIGLTVDAVSGATLEHCPSPVSVTLRRIGSREPPFDTAAMCTVNTPTGADVGREPYGN